MWWFKTTQSSDICYCNNYLKQGGGDFSSQAEEDVPDSETRPPAPPLKHSSRMASSTVCRLQDPHVSARYSQNHKGNRRPKHGKGGEEDIFLPAAVDITCQIYHVAEGNFHSSKKAPKNISCDYKQRQNTADLYLLWVWKGSSALYWSLQVSRRCER